MPLDAVCLRGIVQELQHTIVGLKIEKVQQPTKDQILLVLRGNRRLLLHAGGNQPRIQLTEQLRENPATPPMFCMLLRKHLTGGRIVAVTQPALERLVELEVEILDEMGERGTRRLILEAMGRRSNLLLLDGDGHILDCLRRVDFEQFAQRQLLPGLYYHYPVVQDKRDPMGDTQETFLALLTQFPQEQTIEHFLQATYHGFSPLLNRELSYRTTGSVDTRLEELDERSRIVLWEQFSALLRQIQEGDFAPLLLNKNGKAVDITALPIRQYASAVELQRCDSFGRLLDTFFGEKERQERNRQRGQELRRATSTARDRAARKLALRKKEYVATQNRDTYRLYGELITANLWRMQRGERKLTAENYYEESLPTVEISLDPLLTPQENAARYFKLYTKARTAELYLRDLIQQGETELHYLESVLQELEQAESEQEIVEIRTELQEGGYLRQMKQGKKEPKRPQVKPREFITPKGLYIWVGRNNRQNDMLTLKMADKRDLWFHAQKLHGSHVILCTAGREADSESIQMAAELAAYYSQGKESDKVAVDYTSVRFVKKPSGGRPGMVIYETYQSVIVCPRLP